MHLSFTMKLAVLLCALMFTGCGTLFGDSGVFRGKSKDYLRTGTIEFIEVPADMNSRPLESLFAVADIDPRDEFGDEISMEGFEVPRPEPINVEKGEVGVKIQKLGEKKWIFLNASTSLVWPRAQNFLSQYGFRVAKSDPSSGLIETDDVVFKDDTEHKSRFRIVIEKGIHADTSEIHLTQVEYGVNEAAPETIQWPSVSTNVVRADAILNELAAVLARNIGNNSASLLGQNVGGAAKVEFVRDAGEPTMRLRLFEERAKASVAHALEKDGFVLWQEAPKYGIYYAAFAPKDDGFFSSLFGDEVPETPEHDLSAVLQHLSPSEAAKNIFADMPGVAYGPPLKDAVGLLLVITAAGNSTEESMDLIVRDVRGEKLPAVHAKQVLRLLRKNLI